MKSYEREIVDRLNEVESQLAALSWATWVSVDERLPEAYDSVIVPDGVGATMTAFLDRRGTWYYSDGEDIEAEFIPKLWMPLPPTPVKE